MRRRLLSKPFIIGIVVALIAAGAEAFFLTRGDPASVSYRTGVATLGTVTQTVSLSGSLAADGETDLDFEGAGKVTAVNVQPGQTVVAGQMVVTQDSTTVEASLTQSDATLSAAEANLTAAKAGFSPPAGAAALTFARGMVKSVTGTAVSITDTTGTVTTINVPTTVKVTTSTVIQATALQTGQCVTALGQKDSSGTVAARTLTITPPTATGCTAGFGGGGFGRGGFGGGGFPGGGGGGGTGSTSA